MPYARKGTHGSLSKAGKVRSLHQTWDPKTRSWLKKGKGKKSKNPRTNNRSKYRNRIVLKRNADKNNSQGGQYLPREGQR